MRQILNLQNPMEFQKVKKKFKSQLKLWNGKFFIINPGEKLYITFSFRMNGKEMY